MTRDHRRHRVRALAAGGLALVGGALASATPATAEPVVGEAGTDTSLPRTESAVTVHGRGPFEDLELTVNQTEDLGNQTISITWTGGVPTVRAGGADFAEHFLQFMQCWSEPGERPDPSQCQFGATDAVFGGRNGTLFGAGGFVDDRIIARGDFASFEAYEDVGFHEQKTNWLWMPYRAVNRDEVDVHVDVDFSPSVESGEFWLNPFFNVITTNEIAGGRTRADGTGEELFEVQTGLEANGLGCGQAVLGEGEDAEIPDCWLVVVPRGSAADENAGTVAGSGWEENPTVMTSPLAPAAWANRIEVRLQLNPVDSPCDIDAEQRRIVGSELLLRAVRSWQPTLCATPGLPPYGYTAPGDATARRQLLSAAATAPGMAVTPGPIPLAEMGPDDAVVYAPIALSSLVVAFNVERVPDAVDAGPEAERLRSVRVATINLTPRLVAKLLTQSYRQQVQLVNQDPGKGYEWAEENPRHLDEDPDFLRFNPEFELLTILGGKNFGGLVLAIGTSDSARIVWEWIFADPEAASWLAGEPDEFGMVVNPVYNTDPDENPAGAAFGDPVPDTFPKSEPFCFQPDPIGPGGRIEPPPRCGTDWLPYAATLREAGQRTRAANDGARTTMNAEAISADRVWGADGPQRLGSRAILSIVDSATASQFGLQMARLSRPGDNDDDRRFIAADDAGMEAGLEAMQSHAEVPGFLVPDPDADAPGAYPLTILNYAAVAPFELDDRARAEYAAFVDYAVGDGQVPGREVGQLPAGYHELPEVLRVQARNGANAIRTLQPVDGTTTTTTTSTTAPSPTATTAPAGAGAPATTRPPDRSTPSTAPVVAPPTTVPAVVVTQRPVVDATTTTESLPPGVTPASAVGGVRFVLPFVGGLALLSALGALEITKRPRRAVRRTVPATPAAVIVVAVSTLAATLAVTHDPAWARPTQAEAAGVVGFVDLDGEPIDGGGSAREFALELSGADQCPGDSANDDFRVYSYMVPASLAAEDIVWDGLGPSPRSLERHDAFRMPLFDVRTNEYTAGLTAEREAEGEPGSIVAIPPFSFGVYARDEMPLGDYRLGIACVRLNELHRYWDAEIRVVADADDPGGFAWRVLGASTADAGSSGSSAAAVVAGGALVLAAFVLLVLRRRRPATPSAKEGP